MEFLVLAQQCAPWVHPDTLAAIIVTESNMNPLAIGINGKIKLTRQPTTVDEAAATASWLIEKGHNIDMGLTQVNSANLPKFGLTVRDMFDPCKNITAGASILYWNHAEALSKNYKGQAAILAAVSKYNTGNFSKGFTNGYVSKVIKNGRPVSLSVPSSLPTTVGLNK